MTPGNVIAGLWEGALLLICLLFVVALVRDEVRRRRALRPEPVREWVIRERRR